MQSDAGAPGGSRVRSADAWNVHDAGAFAAAFAEDADFTNVFGMHAKGRAAIEAFHAPIFATMFRDSRLTIEEPQIRMIRPDVASIDARWLMTGARDPHGNPWPERRGLLSFIATRGAAGWQLDVMHNMDLPDEARANAQRALQGGGAPSGAG
ncbi:MAG TPA: SgcJ/EcaC family oxidoreductase [Gammaproteobacteria bacterium]|nr:SgcJ/EcaC family oxidoreductase [Gammaproteobacteria bacterium]